ncbi:TetR/AcrR family transcriptional regulator [Priestia megaterium]|uniref:TetR/AcrR family transcriptional regulator n=2 Tax=Priestia TaxID=2800373 RepID=A0AAX6N8W8_PRIAR|nr:MULTISPECIES: TetR/AcrR family transcriptional regulator [Priestia]MBU8851622.1 TetR/AcrR family transcriptional regulator [Bacillus sp. FJAT-26377]AEN88485.1 Transcriptional regulator, TetR family [Priestia megaterium WSH-002]MDU9691935.1 TetR/AcrR family transcriptional regulator [Priestia aryabhattai]MED5245830.1 TetR/AcrR family transcriptional regulator [Priestia sp. LL-8]PVC69192.1 TetR/AcrR family transcriptional regulator [Priestia megaterium]
MKKVDRRIRKTRKAIITAYLSLLEEKNMHAVSVSDITERADINRATFYAHYEDKQQLQEQSIKEILDDLEEAIEIDESGERSAEFSLTMLHEIFQRMFENIYIHREFYAVMLGEHGPSIFAEKLQDIIRTYTQKGLEVVHVKDINLIVSPDIYLSYVTSAQLGVIHYWRKHQFKQSPVFMAEQLLMLYKLGGATVAEYKE